MTLALPFATGLVGSVFANLMLYWFNRDHRARTILYEGLSIAAGIVAYQVWAAQHNDWQVLAAEGVGALVGTYIAMTYSKEK